MRSKLFVPGARPELFAKALSGEADALTFDLEDSVADDGKAAARAAVAAVVAQPQVRAAPKTIIVRVNAPGNDEFVADIEALAASGVALFNLPKVDKADDVREAVAMIERIESAQGVAAPSRLLLNIETPTALAHAANIAAADVRIAGLQLGLGDLFAPLGIDRYDAANVHAAMFAVRMAAARSGVFALDGAYADLDDIAGFAAEAAMAQRLGFLGKSCIHPRQVPLANAAFALGADELEHARRVVAAAAHARSQGRGACVVDGRMIDAPYLKRAQALVAAAG